MAYNTPDNCTPDEAQRTILNQYGVRNCYVSGFEHGLYTSRPMWLARMFKGGSDPSHKHFWMKGFTEGRARRIAGQFGEGPAA